MKIDGGCHCGKITYEAEIDPEKIAICHCTDCQTLSGTAFRTIAVAEDNSFKFLSGAPKIYVKISESGRGRQQAFCPDCGTPIYAAADEPSPTVHNIRAGSIRQRDQLVPKIQIWARSEQAWLGQLPQTKKVETQPTPGGAPADPQSR